VEYVNFTTQLRPTAIVHIIDEQGTTLFASNDWNNDAWWNTPRKPGLVKARCLIPENFLAEGLHSVLVAVNTYNPDVSHAYVRDAVSFVVVDQTKGNGVRKHYAGGRWPGLVRPMLDWEVEFKETNN
jgi:hypothetical protein